MLGVGWRKCSRGRAACMRGEAGTDTVGAMASWMQSVGLVGFFFYIRRVGRLSLFAVVNYFF